MISDLHLMSILRMRGAILPFLNVFTSRCLEIGRGFVLLRVQPTVVDDNVERIWREALAVCLNWYRRQTEEIHEILPE